MKFFQTVLFLSGILFTLSCEKKECTSPPPSYKVAFVDSQGKAFVNDSLQATTLRLSSTSSTGMRTLVPVADFKPALSNERFKFIYQIGYDLFAQNGQQRYMVEVNSKVVGTLAFTSKPNNGPCDRWMHLTEVRFNDQTVSPGTDNMMYVITLNP